MRLYEKIYTQYENHDGNHCLTLGKGESIEDFLIAEAIHFLYYHRWWGYEDIHNATVDVTFKKLHEVTNRTYRCHPSLMLYVTNNFD